MGNPVMLNSTSELEISLRGTHGRYVCELRFQSPESNVDRRLEDRLGPIDLAALNGAQFELSRYGETLGTWLVSSTKIRDELRNVIVDTLKAGQSLRIRLSIGNEVIGLHDIRWETLKLPGDSEPLFVGENVFFSRYISSADYRPVQRRPRANLRALVVVASPVDLARFKMAPIIRGNEIKRARAALAGIQVESFDAPRAATLNALCAELRSPAKLPLQSYDILYVVCHGAISNNQPNLWLEKDDGSSDIVSADDFVKRFSELRRRPSLIVLASCESSGAEVTDVNFAAAPDDTQQSEGSALLALGPLLAAEGIPAVLAMQGSVTMETVGRFMPVFFMELSRDGQLDRAVAIARGFVRDRLDMWSPVLFSRLKDGGIWYKLGWDSANGFERWDDLKQAIANGQCTPILGPGLLEPIQGNRREIARELAEQFDYPLAREDRDDLPRVAQYRLIKQSRDTVVSDYLAALCARIQLRYHDILEPDLLAPFDLRTPRTADLRNRVVALLRAVWSHRKKSGIADSHQIIASLNSAVYVSTNADPLMSDALGCTATVEFFRWSAYLDRKFPVNVSGLEKQYDQQNPLVFHLFGHLEVPDSLVLAQDDYFEALSSASAQKTLPTAVKLALTEQKLLFLGFNIDDWNFRVLYRLILSLPGSDLLRQRTHVAVQIDPEEQRFFDPRAARRYLEQYVGKDQIEIYWGTADDFIAELKQQIAPAEQGQ